MARRTRAWLTPDSFETDNVCRSLNIPHWSLWSYIDGALAPLTEAHNWEQFGDMTPEQMAEIFSEVLYGFTEVCMNCDDLLACFYGTGQQFRMNAETGALESSSDGGETWQTNTSLDPRLISPRLGLDGAMDCEKAKLIVGYIQQFIDQIKDVITAGSGIIGLTAAITTIIVGILSIGTLTPLIVGLGSAVLGFGVAAIDAALTSDVWGRLVCNLYCNLGDATEVSAEQWELVKAQILEDETGTAETVLWNVVNFLGAVGLQNAVAMGISAASVPADCDACDCVGSWCYTFDFTASDGDWSVIMGRGGQYLAGTGWRTTRYLSGGNYYGQVNIEIEFDTRTLTRLYVEYNGDNGTIQNAAAINNQFQVYQGPTELANDVWNENFGPDLSRDWITEIEGATKVQLQLSDYHTTNNSGSNGTITATRITLEGLGSNPFGADNC